MEYRLAGFWPMRKCLGAGVEVCFLQAVEAYPIGMAGVCSQGAKPKALCTYRG
jgi:hypothetical protein